MYNLYISLKIFFKCIRKIGYTIALLILSLTLGVGSIHSNSNSYQDVDQLEEKIQNLLQRHPEVISLDESVQSYYWDKETKDVLPDTKIGLSYRNTPIRGGNPLAPDLKNREDIPGMTGTEISISQEIPYPEKLLADKKISYWNFRNEKERIQILKNNFFKDFYILSIEKKILKEEIEDWKEISKIQKSMTKISNAGFTSGRGSTFSSLKEKNENIKIKDRLIEMETSYQEVNEALRYFIDKGDIDDSDLQNFILNINDMIEKRIKTLITKIESKPEEVSVRNPNAKLFETNIHLSKEKERRDDLRYLPDTEVFIAYLQRNSRLYRVSQNPINYGSIMPSQEFSGDLLSFGVSLKVPTWSWTIKKDLNRKNRSERNQAIQSRTAIQKKIRTDMSRLIRTIEGTEKRIQYYENELIPTLKRSARIQSAGTSDSSSATSILQLKLDYHLAIVEKKDLYRTKYRSMIQLLELSDEIQLRGNKYESN